MFGKNLVLESYTLRSTIDGGVKQQGWLKKISKTNRWGRGWKKQKILIPGGFGFQIVFFFPFVTMKTTVLRTFGYKVKVK